MRGVKDFYRMKHNVETANMNYLLSFLVKHVLLCIVTIWCHSCMSWCRMVAYLLFVLLQTCNTSELEKQP